MDLNIVWNNDNFLEFVNYLIRISDIEYKEFHSKLTFTKYEILGIRLPVLRKIAKEIFCGDYKSFLNICGCEYYECVMLKCLVCAFIKDKDELMVYFDDLVCLIDNWAICDTFCNSLKIVGKNKNYFINVIDILINSGEDFKIRVGLILLLTYYVNEDYLTVIFKYLDNIESEVYYVNMARAWLLCEVFIKYEREALKYFENNKLNKFTINKAISKIRDSYRVSNERKKYILRFKK